MGLKGPSAWKPRQEIRIELVGEEIAACAETARRTSGTHQARCCHKTRHGDAHARPDPESVCSS